MAPVKRRPAPTVRIGDGLRRLTQAQREANSKTPAPPSVLTQPRSPPINSSVEKARQDVERAKQEEDATRPQGIKRRLADGYSHKEDCSRGYTDADTNATMAGEPPKFNFTPASSAGGSGNLFGSAGANQNQNKPLFGGGSTPQGGAGLFGNTSSTPATSGGSSLFGGGATSGGGGMFGGGGATAGQSQQRSLFGGTTPAASGPGLFGSTPATSGEQGKSLFGATPTSGTGQSNVFGGGAGGSSGFNFGQQKPAGAAPTPASQAPTGPGLFGKQPVASPAATPGEQPKSSAGGMFNTAPASTAGGAGSLFGGGGGSGQSWNFGPTPSSGSGADQNKTATAASVFSPGATPAAKPSGPGLFGSSLAPPGGSTTPQPNKSAAPLSFTPAGNPPSSIFGGQASKQNENQQPAPTQPQQSSGQSLFGTKPAEPAKQTFSFPSATSSSQPAGTGQNAPSLFAPSSAAQGQAGGAATSGQSGASNIFGAKPAAPGTSSAAPASSAAAPSSLFSGLGGGAASSATSQPAATSTAAPFAGFSLGGQTSSSATSQPATTTSAPAPAAGGLFGSTPATAAGGSGGGGLFGAAPSGQQPASSSAAPSTTTSAPAAGGLFGSTTAPAGPTASTSGPAPPQQSRLASKSMDEILTMWSTSLASHQKTFQQLAKRVSAWDRALVENSGKITTLYGRCFQAERDCSEVERQLSNVEHSQSELEAMLDRYEGEVDRLMDGAGMGDGGMGVSGVDAERERTYKTAEHCSTRLTEMSHSLTDMIEEINSASTKLAPATAATNQQARSAEDPLTEIVRVLNSHLAQLQTIDGGATELQAKVAAAQREARTLGAGQGVNGEAGRWVDDFGRSYLGRR
ncbi:hypothetical protein LTR85_005631 [Meristemomyces frigidus]|nr:hypothetical protein LTR85_005631 [Meristemomyces frigidus]